MMQASDEPASGLDAHGGATLVEFALVAVTFLVTVFAFIDCSMVFYLRSCATSAAHQSLSWLSVQPALVHAADHPQLLAEARRRAREYLRNTTFLHDAPQKPEEVEALSGRGSGFLLDNAEYLIPSSPSLQEGLKRDPLKARISFAYRPWLPFFLPQQMTFDVIASGFAERQPEEIEPVLMDCAGNRITSAADDMPKKVLDPDTKQCVCRNIFETSGDDCVCPRCPGTMVADERTCVCHCPPGEELVGERCLSKCAENYLRDPTTTACACNMTAGDCKLPLTFDEANCRCASQSCPPNMAVKDGACVCDPRASVNKSTCAAEGKVIDPLTCTCGAACGLHQYVKDEASCQPCAFPTMVNAGTKCACPDGTDFYSGRGCYCSFDRRDGCNAENKPVSFQTCGCGTACQGKTIAHDDACICPAEQVADCAAQGRVVHLPDCECGAACTGRKKVVNGVCSCTQDDSDFCKTQGKIMDPSTCECQACAEGKVPNNNNGCVCDPAKPITYQGQSCAAANRPIDAVQCACGEPCGSGQKAAGGRCIPCPDDMQVVGGVCVCPGKQERVGSECRCPDRVLETCAKTGLTTDPVSCRCVCAGETCCELTESKCASEQKTFDSASCACISCPPDKIFYNGKCVYPEH
jgi:hypothetical protein